MFVVEPLLQRPSHTFGRHIGHLYHNMTSLSCGACMYIIPTVQRIVWPLVQVMSLGTDTDRTIHLHFFVSQGVVNG